MAIQVIFADVLIQFITQVTCPSVYNICSHDFNDPLKSEILGFFICNALAALTNHRRHG